MRRGVTDNDYLLLRDEPGYRGGEVPDIDENDGLDVGPRGLSEIVAHLARTTDGRCKDCGCIIARGRSCFVGGDRLCPECCSGRPVTP